MFVRDGMNCAQNKNNGLLLNHAMYSHIPGMPNNTQMYTCICLVFRRLTFSMQVGKCYSNFIVAEETNAKMFH